MITRLIDLSLRHRALVIALALACGLWGLWALQHTPVDAIPDLSDNQVIVFTDWPGRSPGEVEDQVTYPLTVSLQGLAGIRVIRGQSAFGFSMIYAVFEDDIDPYFARTRVLERLSLVATDLPAGASPTLGPDATGVGHVFWYTLESPTRSLRDLRTLQDWFVRYQLAAVPGVAEVASVGGFVQQYQIDVDPDRLRQYGLTLGAVVSAVSASNVNVGGNVLESNGAWVVVRGLGLVNSVDDLEQIALAASGGTPVRVREIADVHVGDAFRVGALVKGGREAVGGVVVARTGTNTRAVIEALKARIADIEPGLPDDVTIVPFYDRSLLIDRATGTLQRALVEELLLVTLAHVIFLMHFRSILIVTAPLPLAVLAAFTGMYYAGITSNIMSLAGIAIAIGVLVDAGIVVTENAFRLMEQRGVDPHNRPLVRAVVAESTRLVGRPVFFSMAIILLAFVPVFALTGQEGRLFHPLAFTKTLAVFAATLLAVTLVPVLCTFLIGGRIHREDANPLMRLLRRIYRPVLVAALSHRVITIGLAGLMFIGALVVARDIGSEFMPALDEGDLMFMPIADPSISLETNTRIAATQNAILESFPEVASAVAKVARADTSTDPSPLNMTETIVHLEPRDQWRPGMTLDGLRAELGRAVQMPGVTNIWTMPIINRIDMLTTGIRSEVGIKIRGADLAELERLAGDVAAAVRTVPGATNVLAEALTTGQYLHIDIDRVAAARHGLVVADIQQVVDTAIGESVQTTTIEGRARFPVRVRFRPDVRADANALARVPVDTPGGGTVPLGDVTQITPARGPAMMSSEDGLLVATVLLNVQDRDVGGFVEDARAIVANAVTMPAGYYLTWSGRWENQARARARLQLVVPLVLVIIFGLLYLTYRSALEAAHVLLAVPFALTGGVFLLWLLDYNFSVAVWVGFIALFGTAVQTGMVMVIYLEDAVARKRQALGAAFSREALREAVMEGALLRLRPKLMTVSTVVAGLLPLMWSTSTGADVMKPLATPVLGGMVSSLLHVLVVTPVIFLTIHERHLGLASTSSPPSRPRRPRALAVGLVGAALVIAAGLWAVSSRSTEDAAPVAGQVFQTVRAGDVNLVLSSTDGGLRVGGRRFTLEFRSASGDSMVADNVRTTATMSMPGMAMTGNLQPTATGAPGRFVVSSQFGMAGTWQLRVDWTGPSGPASATFEGVVQ